MGFGPTPPKLSELEIDVSKDWGAYLLKNIGAAVDDNDAVRKVQAILQAVLTTRGDMLYRGASEAERLAADYGVGSNFLHVKNTGHLELEWLDIQALIAYMTGAANVMAAPPSLVISAPDISQVTVQASSPPGVTATPSLTMAAPSLSVAAVIV